MVFLTTSACRRPASPSVALPPVITGQATQHALDDERLREVMRGLGGTLPERLPQELQSPIQTRANLEEASRLAEDLERASMRIAALSDQLGLSTNGRQEFEAANQRLLAAATELARRSKAGDVSGTDRAIRNIEQSCSACHQVFRNPGSSP